MCVCEQLAQRHYMKVEWSEVEPTSTRLRYQLVTLRLQEQPDSSGLRQEPGRDQKRRPVWLPNFNEDSLSTDTSALKISWISGQFHQRCEPNCMCQYLAMLKSPSKIPGSGSGSGGLLKFNKFFLVHSCFCRKNFMKIRSVVLRTVADRQTDRQTDKQTDKRRVK